MKPVVLVVLDGWGISSQKKGNAIALAKTTNYDGFLRKWPHSSLNASGRAVGLPSEVVGNSEVGHMTIGSGRIINSALIRIDQSIKDQTFFMNKELVRAMAHARKNKSALHLMGLLSDGKVHSSMNHLFALLEMAKKQKITHVYVHAFLDGVDAPPKSAGKYIKMLEKKMKQLKCGQIATIVGRYYAMDRDNNWDRAHNAYTALINEAGFRYKSASRALKDRYKHGETDELISPCHVETGKRTKHVVQDNDAMIFFNFRNDRERQITCTFTCKEFFAFERKRFVNLYFVGLVQYDEHFKAKTAFPPPKIKNCLSEIISKKKLKQIKIAESEKYPHLTYFFNAGRDEPFPLEQRKHIETIKVKSFIEFPQLRAKEIADETVAAVNSRKFAFVAVNFANSDLLGQTGNLEAAKKGVEAIDKALGRVSKAVLKYQGVMIITADHGNVEEMLKNGKPSTQHTKNPVPFIAIGVKGKAKKGGLSDVAPTVLQLMGIEKAKEMSGKELLILQ